MKKQVLLLTLFYAFFLFIGVNSYASPFQETTAPVETGMKMNFQGTLFENGEPVNGDRSMTFSIDIDGTAWNETQTVQVIEGLYSVTLGAEHPLPENLFYDVTERNLTVSVGSNTLGTVPLLTPFSPKEIGPANDLPRRIDIDNAKVDSDTIFYFNISADNVTQGSQRGIQVDMTGAGFKIALRGNTLSQEGDATTKIAILGSAAGNGNGSHEGVRGQAFGAGLTNNGILGLAGGPGNGVTGYETGSYNNGVIGYGQSNSWGNIGVSGWAVGSIGVDNIGVAGISAVGEEGNTEIENKGVLGRAEGLGINKAIWGSASGGVENWAGWFEGDVAIRGGKELKIFDTENKLKSSLKFDEEKDAGILELYGTQNESDVKIGSFGTSPGGRFQLYRRSDDNSFTRSAIAAAAYGEGLSYFNLYSENFTADGNTRLVDLYTYDRDIFDSPYSDNYKRSGIDFYDNQGTRLVAISSDKEEGGADPTGKSGFIYLSGTNSPNIELAGKRGENNDLGAIRLYGTTTDGGQWYHSNASVEVNTDGTNQWGRLSLNKTDIANSTLNENIVLDANSGNITISGSLSQSSDARLKKNILTLTSGLATVNRLRGVRYNWKDLSMPENKIGFIAQEVETILPELVNTKADGFKTVNYAEMTAVLVEAVKELSQQIEALQKENISLKAELTGVKDMEDRLAKIEALLGTQNTTQKTDHK